MAARNPDLASRAGGRSKALPCSLRFEVHDVSLSRTTSCRQEWGSATLFGL